MSKGESILAVSDQFCTGCGVCAISCPSSAIEMALAEDGFYRPAVDLRRCIRCGLCTEVCAKFLKQDHHPCVARLGDAKGVFAVSSIDEHTRMTCSSGGAGYELARAFLAQGYRACGVRYNGKKRQAEHFVAADLRSYDASKGSKYLQSDARALKEIWDGNSYVVFGTPCQIYGVRQHARIQGMERNFLLVDLFCHGVPSYNIWAKYLDHVGRALGLPEPKSVRFRRPGWGLAMSIGADGIAYEGSYPSDYFLYLYLNGLGLMDVCYDCPFRFEHAADVRIGDFWGPLFQGNTQGVSLVVAQTDLGLEAVQHLTKTCEVQEVTLDDMMVSQRLRDIQPPAYHAEMMKAFARRPTNIQRIVCRFLGAQRATSLAYASLARWTPRRIKNAAKCVLK